MIKRILFGLAAVALFAGWVTVLVAILPRPVPCLESHVERRHRAAHTATHFVPMMGFDGEIKLDFRTVNVPARDYDVVVCDRYAAEEPTE